MKKFELPLSLKNVEVKKYTIVLDYNKNEDSLSLQPLWKSEVENEYSFMNIHFEVVDGELTKFYVEVN